jgi:pimeloyl-ACP methyl ester carboxylesterase
MRVGTLMRRFTAFAGVGLVACAVVAAQQPGAQTSDTSPHTVLFVTVDTDVKLEVLDWGGSGRALVLVSGLGDTAHIFDRFAPKLAEKYHVYAITRRGFGASSAPPGGYDAIRLGDDVLGVIGTLELRQPVLVGHSIGGSELSSIGSRFPDRVAGLIYLEAAYGWAFYDESVGDFDVDSNILRGKLEELHATGYSRETLRELLETVLPNFARDLREEIKTQDAMPPTVRDSQYTPITGQMALVLAGTRRVTRLTVPALAIYAQPHDVLGATMTDAERATYEARDRVSTGAQADAFERGVPGSRVVRISRGRHYIYRSNDAEVLREIDAFIARLP